ncbi:VC0807 family protein [Mycolicibacterium mucogenicum]|uniref:VC0807 family protein n=1 Tax=Mycolicibacterium mucogenicum TaxID=56689 RepID=UPI0013A56C75|nr:VC0807 family protein [Mycolicibacterium mucogenicum]
MTVMSIDTIEPEPVNRPDAARSAAKRRAMIRTVLEIGTPLVAFYGLRATGQSEYFALLAATIVAGIPVAYGLVRVRRLDPYSGYLMLMFGLTLAVALVTTDPRLVLAGQTLVGGVAAAVFLTSCLLGKPMTHFVAARFMPATTEHTPTTALLALHVRLSAVVGVGLLIQVAVLLGIIFTFPFDVANGLVNAVGSVVVLAIGAVVALMVRRFKQALAPEVRRPGTRHR